MSEFQVMTAVTALIGFVATVLNLVAFVREKDRSHTKAGLRVLALMAVLLGVLFFPRYAPGAAGQLAQRLPVSLKPVLGPWLEKRAPAVAPLPVAVQASFTLDLRRNLLGGIDCLMAHFQFHNSGQPTVISAYQVRYLQPDGKVTHSFDRLLSPPIDLAAAGQNQREVELDPSIRDVWVEQLDREASQRLRMEIVWQGRDAAGNTVEARASNG